MCCSKVVWECMGRGNGESITANAMSSRPTNVNKTNQCPAFVAYRSKEVCMHPHAEKRVCTPTEQPIRTHMFACTTNSKRCFVREHWELMLGMRKHTCMHAGALCTLYAQSKACAAGLYGDHPGCCSVAQVGSRCLSLSCLTTVRRCPQICSNASCFALGTDLRGIRRIVFLLAMALLALSHPQGAEFEAQLRQPEKCNPRLRWKTVLTIALLREVKSDLTRRRGPEGQLRARIQCPW